LPLQHIAFAPLHEVVYAEIRQVLMTGRLEPGQRLTVRGLANALGTSHMPVRAALSRLIAEKALARLDKRVVSVPSLDRARFTDLMQTRILLEGDATARACERITEGQIGDMRQIATRLNGCIGKNDIVEYLELNQALKFSIYRHCGSPTLFGLIEMLWLQVGPCLRHLSKDIRGLQKINYHDDAIVAIAKRRPQAAKEFIQRDIREGMQFILATADFTPESDPIPFTKEGREA